MGRVEVSESLLLELLFPDVASQLKLRGLRRTAGMVDTIELTLEDMCDRDGVFSVLPVVAEGAEIPSMGVSRKEIRAHVSTHWVALT
jgi:hypothetical protein